MPIDGINYGVRPQPILYAAKGSHSSGSDGKAKTSPERESRSQSAVRNFIEFASL